MILVGHVTAIVEQTVVVSCHESGEHSVLDIGTGVTISGVSGSIVDVFGPVLRPMYSVDIPLEGIAVGAACYCQNEHRVLTATLKNKGTDASTVNDMEVPEDEMDFSDDEKEQLYKQKKRGKADARAEVPGSRGPLGSLESLGPLQPLGLSRPHEPLQSAHSTRAELPVYSTRPSHADYAPNNARANHQWMNTQDQHQMQMQMHQMQQFQLFQQLQQLQQLQQVQQYAPLFQFQVQPAFTPQPVQTVYQRPPTQWNPMQTMYTAQATQDIQSMQAHPTDVMHHLQQLYNQMPGNAQNADANGNVQDQMAEQQHESIQGVQELQDHEAIEAGEASETAQPEKAKHDDLLQQPLKQPLQQPLELPEILPETRQDNPLMTTVGQ